jgi:hypothetical protein
LHRADLLVIDILAQIILPVFKGKDVQEERRHVEHAEL